MDKDKIYLDQSGYQDYLEEIERLKDLLNQNNQAKSSAYNSAVGDGWHDNFDFEVALREEFKIMGLLKKKREDLERIVIINEEKNDFDGVTINDWVKVSLFMDGEVDEFSFKLVASLNPTEDEISINSPMGAAIYKKRVGEIASYQVGDRKFKVKVLDIRKERLDGNHC